MLFFTNRLNVGIHKSIVFIHQILDCQRTIHLLHLYNTVFPKVYDHATQEARRARRTSCCSYYSHNNIRSIHVPKASTYTHKEVACQFLFPTSIIWARKICVLKYTMSTLVSHDKTEGLLC